MLTLPCCGRTSRPRPPRTPSPEVTVRRTPVLALLCAAFVLLGAPAAAHACRFADAVPGSVSAARHAQQVRCLVNEARRANGLRPLKHSGRLGLAARRHSRAMTRRDFFSHVSPGGATLGTRVRRVRYRARALGETIAWGQGGSGTPRALVRGWLRSGAHRAILLGRFRHIGVGVSLGSPQGTAPRSATLDAVFGRR